ncbi:hypothetical protein QYE76_000106 [Lolium multiflorum]|uniref:CCHC-type domain-containing protein n=1 Tax=Lolium multiflorum TaxID=4521 RepID=A0AAD8PHW4_LOLMU|nr:hypothetical protein QYE76_000106 [Lolium multiflorum]
MATSSSPPTHAPHGKEPVSIWRPIPSSPESGASGPRRSDERLEVSGMGLSGDSSESGSPGAGSAEVRCGAVDGPRAEEPLPWERPKPSRKTLWRGRVERRNNAGPPSSKRQVAPEMEGLCFRCFRSGHHKRECTNESICFRCGNDGHEAKDCKRPRSPPSEDELRRAALASFARRAPRGIRDPNHPRRQVGARPSPPAAGSSPEFASSASPPPPPPPPPGLGPLWPNLLCPSSPEEPEAQRRRLDTQRGTGEESPLPPLCVVRRSRSMNDLEHRLRHAVVAYVGGDRPAVTCAQVGAALDAQLGIGANGCSIHPYQPEDFIIVLASEDLRRRVLGSPSIHHAGFSLFVKPWTRLAQARKVNQRTRVQLIMEGIPPHAWDREVAEELLGSSCVVEELAPATRSRADLALFRLSAWTDAVSCIPSVRDLVIPEPQELDEHGPFLALRHREEVSTLRYRVLIHVDSVEEDAPVAERSLGDGAADRRQPGGGAGRVRRSVFWQGGVPDRRGGDGGGAAAGNADRRSYRQAVLSSVAWKLPEMGGQPEGHVAAIREHRQDTRPFPGQNSNATPRAHHRLEPTNGNPNAPAFQITYQGRGQRWVKRPSQKEKQTPLVEAQVGPDAAGMDGGAPPRMQSPDTSPSPTGNSRAQELEDGTTSEEDRDLVVRWEDASDSLLGGGDSEAGERHNKEDYFLVSLSGQGDSTEGQDPCSPALSQSGSSLPGQGEEEDRALGSAADGTKALEPSRIPDPELDPFLVKSVEAGSTAATIPVAQNSEAVCTPADVAQGQLDPETAKLKEFCANIIKTLAPPLLREVQLANTLRADAEPFTPRRVTRRSAGTAAPAMAKAAKKASAAEAVLLKALGITPAELSVSEEDLCAFKQLFDAPLSDQHLRIIAAIFGKLMPPSFPSQEPHQVVVLAQ